MTSASSEAIGFWLKNGTLSKSLQVKWRAKSDIFLFMKYLSLSLIFIGQMAIASSGEPLEGGQFAKSICKIYFNEKLEQPITVPALNLVITNHEATCTAFYIGDGFFASAKHCIFESSNPFFFSKEIVVPKTTQLLCDGKDYSIDFKSVEIAEKLELFETARERSRVFPVVNDLIVFKSIVSAGDLVPLDILKSANQLELVKDKSSNRFVVQTNLRFLVFGFGKNENGVFHDKLHGSYLISSPNFELSIDKNPYEKPTLDGSSSQVTGLSWGIISDDGTATLGDSGGPLFAQTSDSEFKVVGITNMICIKRSDNTSCGSQSSLLTWQLLNFRFANGSNGLKQFLAKKLTSQ